MLYTRLDLLYWDGVGRRRRVSGRGIDERRRRGVRPLVPGVGRRELIDLVQSLQNVLNGEGYIWTVRLHRRVWFEVCSQVERIQRRWKGVCWDLIVDDWCEDIIGQGHQVLVYVGGQLHPSQVAPDV